MKSYRRVRNGRVDRRRPFRLDETGLVKPCSDGGVLSCQLSGHVRLTEPAQAVDLLKMVPVCIDFNIMVSL